jgi:uncharacterized protein YgbK (DUF1537 family)
VVRIWADDLTGALDTAAQFTGALGSLPVLLRQASFPGSAAWDSSSRDAPWEAARAGIAAAIAFLGQADLPYLKVDSLLRGHSLRDLAAIFLEGGYRACILAPAFPDQGRVTRLGIQLWREPSGGWLPAGPPLPDTLRQWGVAARLAPSPEQIDGAGIIVCDAASRQEIAEVARRGRALAAAGGGRLLWCGSAGLAGALAGRPPVLRRPTGAPLLLIAGSDHVQSRAQRRAFVAARTAPVITAAAAAPPDPPALADALARHGAALLCFRPPGGSDAPAAMRFIRAQLAGWLPPLAPPGVLVVSGGETLRAVSETLGTDSLVVCGELQPGFPVARFVGGAWSGVPVVSKSGAFGGAQSLNDLARTLAAHVVGGDE